jgi:hypothetical protein
MVFVDAHKVPFDSSLLYRARRKCSRIRTQKHTEFGRQRQGTLTIASADAFSPNAFARPSFCCGVTLASAADTGDPRKPLSHSVCQHSW